MGAVGVKLPCRPGALTRRGGGSAAWGHAAYNWVLPRFKRETDGFELRGGSTSRPTDSLGQFRSARLPWHRQFWLGLADT